MQMCSQTLHSKLAIWAIDQRLPFVPSLKLTKRQQNYAQRHLWQCKKQWLPWDQHFLATVDRWLLETGNFVQDYWDLEW